MGQRQLAAREIDPPGMTTGADDELIAAQDFPILELQVVGIAELDRAVLEDVHTG